MYEFLLPLLQPSKAAFIVTDTRQEVKDPSAKQARLSNTAHPVASVSQPIYSTNRLSIISDFIGCVATDVEFAKMGEVIRGYLRAKLENVRRV